MDNSDPQFRLRTRKSPSMLIDETKRKISPMKKNKKTNERTVSSADVSISDFFRLCFFFSPAFSFRLFHSRFFVCHVFTFVLHKRHRNAMDILLYAPSVHLVIRYHDRPWKIGRLDRSIGIGSFLIGSHESKANATLSEPHCSFFCDAFLSSDRFQHIISHKLADGPCCNTIEW